MVCPKCGAHIKRFDIAQNCRHCGVNILYYTQEKELSRDAKRTEIEFARARAIVGRIKTCYIGNPAAILRLVTGPLSVAALAIPFFKLVIGLPLISQEIATGAIGVYGIVSDGIYTQLLNFFNVGVDRPLVWTSAVHLLMFVLTVLMELVMTLTYFLAAINVKRSAKLLAVFSAITALFDTIGTIASVVALKTAAGSDAISAHLYPGGFVLLAILIVFFISNIKLYKMDTSDKVSDIDKQRIELLKKVKAGEVELDSLPLPVFETEEEREKRINLFGEVENENGGEGAAQ